ncbi:hypothetical protein SAMN05216249_11170 [Acetitomaculum ruminis DSM 5522]|uniref:Uncharacterized protein n=1 Tax=Acetitomaculum ruminis DSM 5522 TaxID=1120918 RepID=A0A1I0YXF7_9FIRM|nr:hypothetical protein [Acetitomaculum ruminis]SFB16908.1 hypothetical protein SAMN05216249_11170 [Acetitomaculum ruminis DSM 5522]
MSLAINEYLQKLGAIKTKNGDEADYERWIPTQKHYPQQPVLQWLSQVTTTPGESYRHQTH